MLKLNLDFDEQFDLIGIACHKADYQLCWGINKILGWDLTWREDIEVQTPNGEVSFARFDCTIADEPIHIDLIANRMNGHFLVPEYPQVDFLLKACDELQRDNLDLIPALRSAPGVMGVFKLENSKIKNLDYLIFD